MRKNNSIRVSIITPSYNQGKYLEETIQSVLNQTYSNIEYLIIDGASTDNSIDIIKKYEEKIDYWISEPDDGQADAINKGLKQATGDFLCWLNSDDILYPDYVVRRLQQFEENPGVDMIYGDIEQGPDPSNKRLHKGRQTCIRKMLKYVECPIPQQSAMWRRKATEKIGNLDIRWHVLLDREYFIRMAVNCSIKYIPGAVAFFRNHEQSKSIVDKLKWAKELPRYYEMVFNNDIYQLPPNLLTHKNKCLSRVYLKCARIFTKAGKKHEAEESFCRSRKLSFYNYILNRYIRHLF
jgi:glycosyltransferase involved in cell wall biosynthesis